MSPDGWWAMVTRTSKEAKGEEEAREWMTAKASKTIRGR
jgi:hypothetical protein